MPRQGFASPQRRPESDPVERCVAADGCTTDVRNTHKTGSREVLYRWHPWHGQRVLSGEARRAGGVVLRCVRDELERFPALEIAEWMFDCHACGRMKPAQFPLVDCAALLALQHLLSAVTERNERCVIQAQHPSSSSGDADAQTDSVQKPSRQVVFSASEAPRVASGSTSENGSTAGQDAERIPTAPQWSEDRR
jgi:hypothetical protein